MPHHLCENQLMEHPVAHPCYCVVRLCGKKKRTRRVDIITIEIHHMNFSNISNPSYC